MGGPSPDGEEHEVESLVSDALRLPPGKREPWLHQRLRDRPNILAAAIRRLRDREVDADQEPDPAPVEPARPVATTDVARLAQALARAKSLDRDRFELVGLLGGGAMGTVMQVEDRYLGRALAMKVLRGAALDSPPDEAAIGDRLRRFLVEAQITSQLDHPGVVPVHDIGVDDDGKVFFTMNRVRGDNASEVFRKARAGKDGWDRARALEVILRVCDTMAYAHERGVLHRDLKPDNLRVGSFGEAYVMDWGLAKVEHEADWHDLRIRDDAETSAGDDGSGEVDSSLVTMDGSVLGTVCYMSPEQARGLPLDRRADVYSIGACLYELLAGEAPYWEERGWPREVLRRVQAGSPKPIRDLSPALELDLAAIVEKAMARDRDQRYASVGELSADLRAFLDLRVVKAYRPGAIHELMLWVRRNRPLAASLAAAVLILVAGILVSSWLATQNAALARQSAVLVRERTEQAMLAEDNAKTAEKKSSEVLSLSAQKDYEDLVAEAATLWPAYPKMIPAYEDWMRRANELIAGRPADHSNGVRKRPSLPEHKAKLEELRRNCRPLTKAEVQAERESHPKFSELNAKREELLWRSRMLGLVPWPSEAAVEAQLASELLPSDADALNALVRPDVDPFPATPSFGKEVRALLLARRAVASSASGKRAGIRDTLAWALMRTGHLDEALTEGRAALSEPGGEVLKKSVAVLEEVVAKWRGENLERHHSEGEAMVAVVAALDAEVTQRRTFCYEDSEAAWWDSSLSRLVGDLELLGNPNAGLMGDVLAQPFGWGVLKRYKFAKSIGERSVGSATAKLRWDAAMAAIRTSPKYGGLVIQPEIGLIPIGMDPDSELWEFAHLQTGDIPVRMADGKLVLTENTGLIFVLLPGGTFWMGAQRAEARGRNYDPQAWDEEGPVHERELSPFFLSKYEMTQGQWQRLLAANPSVYRPGDEAGVSLLHPVENVSWTTCFELLASMGLSLPSEAQWEYGGRGGMMTAWWTGQHRESLRGNVNIADQAAKRAGAPWDEINDWPDLDDGSVVHCAIGQYGANGFGLHDVAGNVKEWCLDGFDPGFYYKTIGIDGFAPWSGNSRRIVRDGCFLSRSADVRSAVRRLHTPDHRSAEIGVRPARALRMRL